MADLSSGVEQCGGRRSLLLRQVAVLFARSHVSLLARRGRQNREPNYAATRPLLLQLLHVAAVVVLPYVGAAVVVPLEDHILSAVIRQVNRLAVARRGGEFGRCFAGFPGQNQW